MKKISIILAVVICILSLGILPVSADDMENIETVVFSQLITAEGEPADSDWSMKAYKVQEWNGSRWDEEMSGVSVIETAGKKGASYIMPKEVLTPSLRLVSSDSKRISNPYEYVANKNAYLEFDFYTSSTSTENLPTKMYMYDTSSAWRAATYNFPADSVTMNGEIVDTERWHHIKIPLHSYTNSADFMETDEYLRDIRLMMPTLSSNVMVAVSDMKFTYEVKRAIVLTSAVQKINKMRLEWVFENGEAEYYKVYCNGKCIGTTADTSYEQILSEFDVVNEYYIEAYDDSNNLIFTGEKAHAAVYNYNAKILYEIISDDGTFGDLVNKSKDALQVRRTAPSWDTYNPAQSDLTAVIGGKSTKWLIKPQYTAQELRIGFEEGIDLGSYTDDAWVEMLICIDSQNGADAPVRIETYDGAARGLKYNVDNITPGQWRYIKIPVDYSESTTFDFSDILRWQIIMPSSIQSEENYYVYIQNMSVKTIRENTTTEVVTSGMDNNGDSFVKLKFSRDMDEDTISTQEFSAEGLKTKNTVYNSDEKTITVTFEEQLEFPEKYILNIKSGLKDTDGFGIETKTLEFETKDYQNGLYINSCTIDKSGLPQGEVKINVNVETIYQPKGQAFEFVIIAAVRDNDRIIDIEKSKKITAAGRGENISAPQMKLTSDDLKTLSAEAEFYIYLVDAKDGLTPLCDVLKK